MDKNLVPNLHVYISCHKMCYVPKFSFLRPIQVGTAISDVSLDMLHDDIGANISEKNRSYCELTAQYWAWKNDNDADYYGFWHYRRYMSFLHRELPHNKFEDVEIPYLDSQSISNLCITQESVCDFVKNYDVIATTPVRLHKLSKRLHSIRDQYCKNNFQFEEDLDLILEIIKEKYPDFYETALYYINKSPVGYYCNMFIMRKELFKEYSEWLFSILSEFENRKDFSDYTPEAYRVCGYLGERLFGIYYLWLKKQNKYKCCELQRTLFKNVDTVQNLIPAFKENNIPVALAADNNFIPYLAVTLKSIIDNSNTKNNYDVLILSSDISESNKKLIQLLAKECKNFSIRFINPKRYLQSFSPFLHGHFGHIETYYRLLLPQLLPEYSKIIYLDSDMVVLDDIAKIFETDVSEKLLAACRDADSAGLYNGCQVGKKNYIDNILQLKRPYDYFQAGTILLNLEEFRKTYSLEELLEFSASEEWQLQDQDVLNKLCEGRIAYLDMSWNVMVDLYGVRVKNVISQAPHWLTDLYMTSRKNPKIIHYAGPEKPWFSPEMDYGWQFWTYARNTPFYEILIKRMQPQSGHRFVKSNRDSSVIRFLKGGLNCILDHGLFYTIKYIPKRIFGRE